MPLPLSALTCALAPFAAGQEGSQRRPAFTPRTQARCRTTEPPATAASVKPSDQSVITLNGACKTGAENGCVTAVSREQFEQMS